MIYCQEGDKIKFTEIKEELEKHASQSIEDKLQFLMYYLQKLRFQKSFGETSKLKGCGNINEFHPGKAPLFYFLSQEENSNLNLKEISEKLNIQQPSLTVMLNRLERDGLVTRTRDDKDLRKQRIFLNEKGIKLTEKYAELHKNIGNKIFEGLSEEEKICFYNIIMKIIENLCKL